MSEPPATQPNIFATVLGRKITPMQCGADARRRDAAGPRLFRVSWLSRPDPSHGDMATNAAMVLAKDAGTKPRELAEAHRREARADPLIDKVDVAGPASSISRSSRGLDRGVARGAARRREITAAADSGRASRSTSNMFPPIRPGRCMSAIAAARCSATRLRICSTSPATRSRANITSTTPAPRSMCSRARRSCAIARRLAKTSARSRGLYPGDYLKPVGEALADRIRRALLDEAGEPNGCRLCAQRAIEMMMAMIRDDLAALNVTHDVFFSERSLIAAMRIEVARHIEWLRDRATSTKAGCRRRRARRSKIGRTANRPCSAPPHLATMSTGR